MKVDMARSLRIAAAVLAGVLYGLCFPPLALKPLAWVALVPLLVAVRRAGRWEALGLGIVFAAAGTCATVDWLPRTVSTYYAQPVSVGIGLFLAVLVVTVVPWVAGWVVWYRHMSTTSTIAGPLLAAAAWVAAELGRASVLTGNPWVLFGYAQVGVDHVVQIADATGVYGISFVLVAVNAALADAWLAARRDGRLSPAALAPLAAPLALVLLTLGYGAGRLRGAVGPESSITVAAVQGNVDLGSQWNSAFYGQALDVYQRLSAEVLTRSRAPLIVWPENAMTFFLADEPAYRAAVASVLRPWSAELIAGGVHTDGGRPPRYYNSAFAVAPTGEILARYDKIRLLPFAEYFPLSELDFLRREFGRVRELTASGELAVLPTPLGPAGVLICNEALFGADARRRVRAGATVLVNLSNDSWMNDRKFSGIAFDMSSLRAVEQRRYLVRASTSGPSGIVDPYGRVTARSGMFTADTVSGAVAPMTIVTPYARVADLFAWTCAGVAVIAPLARRRRRHALTFRRDAAVARSSHTDPPTSAAAPPQRRASR
jgi:apolipoprotein N-acyltransferase